MPTNERIKVSPFTGNENWQVWIARFDTISDRMGWGDEQRQDHLLQNIEWVGGRVCLYAASRIGGKQLPILSI
jgi:hypothetical protein